MPCYWNLLQKGQAGDICTIEGSIQACLLHGTVHLWRKEASEVTMVCSACCYSLPAAAAAQSPGVLFHL